VLVVGFLGMRRILPKDAVRLLPGWTLNFLAGLQVLLAVFGGCGAIHRATLRDYQTKMIESHRLTPMSNGSVAIGYLFGATLQIMVVFFVVTAFGTVLSVFAALPVGLWLYGNLLMLNGAITLWAVVVFSGVGLGKPVNPVGVLILIALLGHVWLFVIPAAGLFVSAYSIAVGIALFLGAMAPSDTVVLLVAASNVLLTVFWMAVAAAKYRRPDLPALNAFRGLLLLGIWLVLGTLGILGYAQSGAALSLPWGGAEIVDKQWVATMTLSLMVALIPLVGTVECRLLVRRGASPRDWSDRVSDVLVAVIAAVMICLVMGLIGIPIWRDLHSASTEANVNPMSLLGRWCCTIAACLLAMFSARGLSVVAYSILKSPKVVIAVLILLAWGGPPLVDFVFAEFIRDYGSVPTFTWIFGCSPTGTITMVWTKLQAPVWPGLIPQAFLAVLLTLAAWRFGTRGSTVFEQSPAPRTLADSGC
jgi:hypothetical protein